MKRTTFKAFSLAFALTLTCLLLAACSGQSQQSSSAPSSQPESSSAASLDVSSWNTLGDALAKATNIPGSGYDNDSYVTVFEIGDSVVRAVVKMDAGTYNKISELDMLADDYIKKVAEVAGGLKLESAEDITADKLSPNELNTYVGKTGQNLIDDGFTFSSYYLYGGEETGATMDKGFFEYGVTFDAKVSENQTEDQGAAIKDAKVKSIEYAGIASSAFETGAAK